MSTRVLTDVPDFSGVMVKVDSKGRVVLPKKVRERLGMTPGTEVAIREEDGKAIIEPEADPEQILERMEHLVARAVSDRAETTPFDAAGDPVAQRHRAAVRSGAANNSDE